MKPRMTIIGVMIAMHFSFIAVALGQDGWGWTTGDDNQLICVVHETIPSMRQEVLEVDADG